MLKVFSFVSLMALVTSGAVLNEPRPTSNPIKFTDNSQSAEEKVMSTYGTSGAHTPHMMVYKPVKFDGASGGSAAAASAPHPYTYEAAPSGSFAVPAYEEPPYPYGGKTAHVSPHKFGFGKLDLHNSLFRHDGSPWKKIVKILTAAIPIGLFLAALPPNVVHINATQTVKPLGTVQKQRSTEDGPVIESFPVLEMIEKHGGFKALNKDECDAFLFCQIARLGKEASANSVQQGFWAVAHETPAPLAELLNVGTLFKAVRDDACNFYNCPAVSKEE
ncbi:uncharacterized protein LOC135943104 [Cloeon dipterum]|uniref:uncharacterized protein LOC135943104 n=1 Tax=Cloeon dipterum TaxID=197152 RepID=UPI00321F6F5C